jgi:di/tricarboxylate transporter
MTSDILLSLSILIASVVFFITEWVPMEVVSLLVMGTVAVTGLVGFEEALSGFSSPAVVTVWAVFILGGSLTRTGVAGFIGSRILFFSGSSNILTLVLIMVSSGVMSAFMNNVAVAALMLPVVMDIARRTGIAPSQLLLPLAYGSLLGGLTTLIGTPPNILVSNALRNNGLNPFGLFDFLPVGGTVMAAGILFMTFVGRRLLPHRDPARESSGFGPPDLEEQYHLRRLLFLLRIPPGSRLVDKSLAESRFRSVLGLNVVGIVRDRNTLLAPDPSEIFRAGDKLLVEGDAERIRDLSQWRQLSIIDSRDTDLDETFTEAMGFAEVTVAPGSAFSGKTLHEIGFFNRFRVNVLAVRRGSALRRVNLSDELLFPGDVLLIQGREDSLSALKKASDFQELRSLAGKKLIDTYHLDERLLITKVPEDSFFAGKTLKDSRLGEVLGMRALCIRRRDGEIVIPEPEESFREEDMLVLEGDPDAFRRLDDFQRLEVIREVLPEIDGIETDRIGLMEAVLSPHGTIYGKTLRQIHFREKYGLSVLAIWREGQAYYDNLRDMALRFGDALLLYGPRNRLPLLGREPDFLVLTEAAQEEPRTEKMKLSVLIMAAVVVPVLLGWIPIYISAVLGAALTILTRCLTMEEAYRYIEWKAVFLIAGMLPLGVALDRTGAARLLADGMVALFGPFGPMAVLLGLIVMTFLAACFIPPAALVVLMAPIVMRTSAEMGISPYALMMAVAVTSASSFMTPISHPANLLVMGPGGYRFSDYLRVGVPLALLVLLVEMAVLPLFWPLTP